MVSMADAENPLIKWNLLDVWSGGLGNLPAKVAWRVKEERVPAPGQLQPGATLLPGGTCR